MCRRLYICFTLLLFFFSIAFGDTTSNIVISGEGYYGKVINNITDLVSLETKNISIAELNFSKQTQGRAYWHQYYFYPKVGVSCLAGYLQQNALGNVYSIFPTFSLQNHQKRPWQFYIKGGLGLAYFSNFYHRTSNNENLFIGSSITAHANLKLGISKQVSSKVKINAFGSALHFSNGHVQVPNYGINVVSAGIGLEYSFAPYKKQSFTIEDTVSNIESKWLKNARLAIGIHELAGTHTAIGGTKYPIYAGSFYLSKQYRPVSIFHVGMHYNYYVSYYDFIIHGEILDDKPVLNASNVILFAGQEYLFGKFSFVLQGGINVFSPFNTKLRKLGNSPGNIKKFLGYAISNKLGIQYYLKPPDKSTKNNLFMGMYIKANFGQADFIEYGLGYVF